MSASVKSQTAIARLRSTELATAYAVHGKSIPDIARLFDLPPSGVRTVLIETGVALRQRHDAARAAFAIKPNPLKGKSRPKFSEQWRRSISDGRIRWGDKHAAGISKKATGYIEVTRGPEKGRGAHVLVMEKRLGRRLLPDEHVHHIDGDRSNNDENNLALVTRSGHARLHRLMEAISGKKRERHANGRLV